MTSSNSGGPLVFSPDSRPYGLTYSEWSAKWCQWLLSIPKDLSPAVDSSGKNCYSDQTNPNVWFLPGTIADEADPRTGTFRGFAERACTVPSGKSILYPILSWTGTLADEPDLQTDGQLTARAKLEMDIISKLEVDVDGQKLRDLEKYRVQSPIFEVVLPEGSLFGGASGTTRGVSDGYWLFLKPMLPGKHRISSSGSCLAGRIKVGVTYHLTINRQSENPESR